MQFLILFYQSMNSTNVFFCLLSIFICTSVFSQGKLVQTQKNTFKNAVVIAETIPLTEEDRRHTHFTKYLYLKEDLITNTILLLYIPAVGWDRFFVYHYQL